MTDFLDFNNLGRNNNPTYEYWPPKPGQWPRKLDILEWAYPYHLYPMAFTLPSGNVMLFVSNKTSIINPETEQVTNNVADLIADDHMPFVYPHSPHMVLLPLTKKNNYTASVLICGGSKRSTQVASNDCYKISPEVPNAKWERVDPMPHGRVMPDSIILPDGKVLWVNGAGYGVAGGKQGGDSIYAGNPVFSADLFDPEAPAGRQWTTLANASIARLYHSGAILVPSGHVLATGSEMQNYVDNQGPTARAGCYPAAEVACTDPFEYRIEAFSPPYLTSNKPRPQYKNPLAPLRITYNSTFVVDVASNGTAIQKANLIRYSSTTHSTNTDQRLVELDIVGRLMDKVYVKAPENGGLAPPGNWMLFLLADDIPSIGLTINLINGRSVSVEVPKSAKTAKSSNGQLISLSWLVWATLLGYFVLA